MKKEMLKPYLQKDRLEAGCDEAGRGCLAGPVFAAAVVLPPDFYHPLLNDSKQMSKKHRDQLREVIEKEAMAWSVAQMGPGEIDRVNILRASILSMHKALDGLTLRPDFILVDGNKFIAYGDTPHACIVKGDATYASIAAASVLAKTHRDEYMCRLSLDYPAYDWDKNMGYGTLAHRIAIKLHGHSPHHRLSFKLKEEQLALF